MDAEVQGLWQLKQAGGGDAGEIDHAEAGGQQISGDDADEDGRQLEKALGKMVQPRHHRQGEEGHQPVLPGAVGGV